MAGSITVADLAVRLTGDTSDFDKNMSTSQSKLSSFGSKAASTGKSMSLGLTLPLIGLGAASVKAFSDSEAAQNKLQAVLKSTGGVAGVTAEGVNALSARIQEMSVIDDEAATNAQSMLLTFTNIKNVGDGANAVFDRATIAATNMSQAMGTDLQGSIVQVGKALNDPVKGISALSKVGVSFTEDQKKVIEKMVATGDTAGAQKLILAELGKEFGGVAKAMADTPAGELQQSMNDLGNAAEGVGAVIAPMVSAIAGWVSKIAKAFQGLSPTAQKIIVAILGIVAAVGPLLLITAKLIEAFKVVQVAMAAMSINPFVLIIAGVILLAVLIVKNWGTIKKFLFAVWEVLKKAGMAVWNVIGGVVMAVWNTIKAVVGAVIKAITIYIQAWLAVVKAVFNAVKFVAVTVWNAIKAAVAVVWAVIKGIASAYLAFWKMVFNAVASVAKVVWKAISAVIRTVWGIVKAIAQAYMAFWKTVFHVVAAVAKAVWTGIKKVISVVWGAIKAIATAYKVVWTAIFNAVKAVVVTVWNGIKAVISGVVNVVIGFGKRMLSGFVNIWNTIKSTAVNAWNGIKGAVTGVFDALVSAGRTAFNAIAGLWNNTIGKLSFHIPDWVPGIGGNGFDVPDIPLMAKGGMFKGAAVIGETMTARPEVALPLHAAATIRALAGALKMALGQVGPMSPPAVHQPMTADRRAARLALTVNVSLDRRRFAKANDREYAMRGW